MQKIKVIKYPCIYYLFKGEEIVYVGSTANIYSRIAKHIKTKDFDSFTYRKVTNKDIFEVEAREIIKHQPKLNLTLPASIYWSQSKAKSRGVCAVDYKYAWRDSTQLHFNGAAQIHVKYLSKYLIGE